MQNQDPHLHHHAMEEPFSMNLKKRKRGFVIEMGLGGYVETSDEDELGRTKSLTDDDLEELKGCLDLGFGFNYEEIPELRNTLPALELCYSMTQKYLDDHQKSPESMSDTASTSSASNPIANWKISSPGSCLHGQIMQLEGRSNGFDLIRKEGETEENREGHSLHFGPLTFIEHSCSACDPKRQEEDCISRELKAPETSFQERDTE
nr:uncharacterized protein LOC109167965 [Ipomoea batatas]